MEAWGSYIFSKQQIKAALIQVIVQVCLTLKLAETTMLYWQLGKLVCLLLESHVDRKQRQLGIYGVPWESHLWEKRFKKSLIFLRSYKMIAVMLQMWIISQGRLVSANVKLFWENGLNVDVSVLAGWERVPKAPSSVLQVCTVWGLISNRFSTPFYVPSAKPTPGFFVLFFFSFFSFFLGYFDTYEKFSIQKRSCSIWCCL